MAEIIGEREGDSRVYAKEGVQEECAPWYDALHEIVGPCVSPGGVAMYCPVTRAATHRRIREGRLSCFTYHVKERKINFFGKLRGLRDTPYSYVPVSECRAWRKELEEKALRNERVTQEELEGAVPDWDAEFLEWESRWRKEQRKLGGPRNIPVTIKLARKEVECLEPPRGAIETRVFDQRGIYHPSAQLYHHGGHERTELYQVRLSARPDV